MANVIKALLAALFLAVGYGCQTSPDTSDRVSPTHRWLPADSSVTQARYAQHHNLCVEDAGVNPNAIRRADPAFRQYEECMTAKGYILATY